VAARHRGHGTLARVRLSLYEFETGVETIGGNRVVYEPAADRAHFGAATVDAHALVWQLDRDADEAEGALVSRAVDLDPYAEWIVRCDRVDFPKGGVAHLHTHPGPGIRYLLRGEIEIATEGRSTFYGPGAAWFEAGPDPVRAVASSHQETSFVRVLVLPSEWSGKRTIRYVDPADEQQPKLQRATVYFDHPFCMPR
jgi:quercetin dioxygenase-like cupin family protein